MGLVLRKQKGQPLTHDELDGNFSYLNDLVERKTQIVNLIDYGIKGIRDVDYTLQLMQMRSELSANRNIHYIINAPGGHIMYTNNRWLFGINSFTLEGNGVTLYPCLTPAKAAEGETAGKDDNMLGRTFFNGELLQTNTIEYNGTKTYFNCPKIFTALAGTKIIKVQTISDISDTNTYYVGARITVSSRETVFDGYPWGTRNFENVNYITAIDRVSGTITLKYVLKYDHSVDNPDCLDSSGGGSGIARIIPLDSPSNRYSDYAEFKNLSSVAFSVRTSESFAFIANYVVIRNCEFPKLVTPTETLGSFKAYDSKFGGGEFDKLVGDVYYENVDNTGYFLSNGGGCRSVEIQGGSIINSFQPNSPYVKLNKVTLISNSYPTIYDLALQNYPGNQPIYEYEISNLKFIATEQASVDSFINIEHLLSYTIINVDSDGTIVIPFDGTKNSPGFEIWKCLDVGFGFWKNTGDKGGVVSSITYDSTRIINGSQGSFLLKGNWEKAVAGEIWNWSYIKNFIDKGGHTMLTPGKVLYDKNSYKLKGKNVNGNVRKLNIHSSELKANAFQYFELHAFVSSVELILDNPMSAGRLSVTINSNPMDILNPDTIVNFSLTSNTKRKFDEYGGYNLQAVEQNVEPDLNQFRINSGGKWANSFGIFCGNIPSTGLGNFTLVVTLRTY